MKKLLIIFIFIMFNNLLFAQSELFNNCKKTTFASFNIGAASLYHKSVFNFGFNMLSCYIDYSSNYATGKGTYLDWKTGGSHTHMTDKQKISVFNIGWQIPITIQNNNGFFITPYIGFASKSNIYEDNLAFNTYYYGDVKSDFNFGINFNGKYTSCFGIYVGIGYIERFKTGIFFYI